MCLRLPIQIEIFFLVLSLACCINTLKQPVKISLIFTNPASNNPGFFFTFGIFFCFGGQSREMRVGAGISMTEKG